VGAQRPFRLVKELPALGWNAAVVALDSKGVLSEAERQALASVPIHRIRLPWDRTQSALGEGRSAELRSALREQRTAEKHTTEQRTAAGSNAEASPWLVSWIDRNMPLDTWLPAMMLGMRGVERFARSQSPAAIWSTGDPWSSHWIALRLKAAFDIPWIADFRDPWTLSTVPLRARSKIAAHMDRRIERRVMEGADRIMFTCQAAADRYAEHYPGSADRIRVVHNCAADPSTAASAGSQATSFMQRGGVGTGATLNILFAGRFRRLSPMHPMLEVLKAFRTAWESDADGSAQDNRRLSPPLRIHHIGSLDADDRATLQREGLADWFMDHPDIAQERLLEALSTFDLLLLSTHPSRDDIIPAKLWDYLAVDRLILSLCPNPEIAEWLEASAAGVQFEPGREGDAASWLMGVVVSFRREGGFDAGPAGRRSKDLLQRISSRTMAARMVDILEEVAR
jgi:hypothetical protein